MTQKPDEEWNRWLARKIETVYGLPPHYLDGEGYEESVVSERLMGIRAAVQKALEEDIGEDSVHVSVK